MECVDHFNGSGRPKGIWVRTATTEPVRKGLAAMAPAAWRGSPNPSPASAWRMAPTTRPRTARNREAQHRFPLAGCTLTSTSVGSSSMKQGRDRVPISGGADPHRPRVPRSRQQPVAHGPAVQHRRIGCIALPRL